MSMFMSNYYLLTGGIAVFLAGVAALVLPMIFPGLDYWYWQAAMVAVVAVGLVAVLWWRNRRQRKAAKALADGIDEAAASAAAADAEAKTVKQRMAEAMERLRKASGKKRNYLYGRPWYVIIGPPGAGKTTALVNSGLQFPFSDPQAGGVGGTRNLDFWFADEAVLIDTAGRYTLQDSDAQADARGWQRLLQLLRKHRPSQPVNGVLVTIGLDLVIAADRAELDRHAAVIRRRLAELREALEIEVPVYLLFSKADLIAGFGEYFEDLDVDGRRAVVGATLPVGQSDARTIAGEYDLMLQAVTDRRAKRLNEERDVRRRAMILGFPAQLTELRARILRLIDGAFGAEGKGGLRGFYLTSGVQEGTPLDRLMAGLAQVYEQPQQTRGGGRAYFLNRLLHDVIIGESGLVQRTSPAERRDRRRLVIGSAVIGAIALILLAGWGVSYFANRVLQGELLASANSVESEMRALGVDLVETRASDPDLEQSLSILRALRNLPGGHVDGAEGPPWSMRWGLFQSSHAEAADQAYLEALRRIMLPRLILRTETYMREKLDDPMALYEPLKAYLLLGGRGPVSERKAAATWIKQDWAQNVYPGADREDVRKELGQHLDTLVADLDMNQIWVKRRVPLDGALIESARGAVQRLSLAERAYAILRQKAANAGHMPWRADRVLAAGDERAFANGDAVKGLTVPWFFTAKGYSDGYRAGLRTVSKELSRDLWVLGEDAAKLGIRQQLGGIQNEVATLYANEYVKAWDQVVDTLQPGPYFSDPGAFGTFTRNPSPFKLILLALRKNTIFKGPDGNDAASAISAHFKPVNDYVGDGKAPGPIDEFVSALKQAGAANVAAGTVTSGVGSEAAQGNFAMSMGSMAAAAATAPPSLQAFVSSAATGGKQAVISHSQGAVSEQYAREILPRCRAAVTDRYPFFGNSEEDAAVGDVLEVFGMHGILDQFVSGRLMPLLDTSGSVWRWRSDDPVAAAFDPTSAEKFQKAMEIKEIVGTGLPLKVNAAGFGGSVTAAEFSSGGKAYRYDPGLTRAQPLTWAPTGGVQEAHVTLFAADEDLKRFEADGPWALFRLMEKARRENSGPKAIKATFGEGVAFATFRIELTNERNPFGRGGIWSFRCPGAL